MLLVRLDDDVAEYRCPTSVLLGRHYREVFAPWPVMTPDPASRSSGSSTAGGRRPALTTDFPMAKILLIAGDLTQSDRMAAFLAQHDFDPAQVSRGDLAVQAFRRHCAEIVVLDASPPGRDGLKVCRDLRALSAVPILMLSDIRNGQAQVQALDAGADDYVVRPVSPHVLLARIRALLRRRNRSPLAPHRLAFGELVIDCEQRLAWQRGARWP